MTRLIPLFVLFAVAGASAAAQGNPGRSVWDGVYTADQATRGEKVYGAECTRCHGDTLLGGEAPALTGPLFAANWEGVPLNDLLDRIRTTMPQDAPGTLSRQDTADVIAFMLKVGRFPTGETPLDTDAGTLAQITFLSNRPQP